MLQNADSLCLTFGLQQAAVARRYASSGRVGRPGRGGSFAFQGTELPPHDQL